MMEKAEEPPWSFVRSADKYALKLSLQSRRRHHISPMLGVKLDDISCGEYFRTFLGPHFEMTFPPYCAIDCTIAVERPTGHWNYQENVGKTSGLT